MIATLANRFSNLGWCLGEPSSSRAIAKSEPARYVPAILSPYPNQPRPETKWEAEIDEMYIMGSQELDRDKRVGYYHRAQEIAAENAPVIYTTLQERLSAVRNVFGNLTPTLYALWDIRYLVGVQR